jgi:hypothetical protein
MSSNWFHQIVNIDSVPKGQIYVAIQNGKAMRYNDASHFGEIKKVLSFPSVRLANYFIENWGKSDDMHDYRQAMPKESFIFYVYDKCNDGYYADDIRMYPEWESTII